MIETFQQHTTEFLNLHRKAGGLILESVRTTAITLSTFIIGWQVSVFFIHIPKNSGAVRNPSICVAAK